MLIHNNRMREDRKKRRSLSLCFLRPVMRKAMRLTDKDEHK